NATSSVAAITPARLSATSVSRRGRPRRSRLSRSPVTPAFTASLGREVRGPPRCVVTPTLTAQCWTDQAVPRFVICQYGWPHRCTRPGRSEARRLRLAHRLRPAHPYGVAGGGLH